MTPELDVAVVGGGVAGLSLAYTLQGAGLAVRVFEAADEVGGRMHTRRYPDGYLVDEGAETVPSRGNPETWRLIRDLGIGRDEVPRIGTSLALWRDDRVHHHLGRPLALLTGAGLSPRGRRQLARFTAWTGLRRRAFDPDHPEATPLGETTVAGLGDRFGHELHDYLFQPVSGGFFGWHPERSAAAPFVSLLLAVGSSAGWRTYRDGMDTLARRLAERVPVTTGFPVREVVAEPRGARVVVADRAATEVSARTVALCVPAPVARQLYADPPEDELPFLAASTYTPMLRVSCLLDRPLEPDPGRPVYALVVPAEKGTGDGTETGTDGAAVSVLMIDHHKHPGRVPAGAGLVTLLASPDATRELIDAPDREVSHHLVTDAERYLPGLRDACVESAVHRFRHGLPEATPAALRLRRAFLDRPARSVEYAGDWVMARPASEGALRSASLAAHRILARVEQPRSPRQQPRTARSSR